MRISDADLDLYEEGSTEISWEKLFALLEAGKARLVPVKYFGHNRLKYLADRLLKGVADSCDEDAEGDLIAVVLLQAASLECFLNDVLIDHAREAFGKPSRKIAEGFISGSVKAKLYRVVPIVSNGRKTLDLEAREIQIIHSLIAARNRLAHTTEHYLDESENCLERPQKSQFARTLTIKQCQDFSSALDELFYAVWNGPIEIPPWQHGLIRDAAPET